MCAVAARGEATAAARGGAAAASENACPDATQKDTKRRKTEAVIKRGKEQPSDATGFCEPRGRGANNFGFEGELQICSHEHACR